MGLSMVHPVVEQLAAAATDAQRARLLLALPHSTVLDCGAELRVVCMAVRFDAGQAFIATREAYLLAVLDRMGRNPGRDDYDARRLALAALAAAGGA